MSRVRRSVSRHACQLTASALKLAGSFGLVKDLEAWCSFFPVFVLNQKASLSCVNEANHTHLIPAPYSYCAYFRPWCWFRCLFLDCFRACMLDIFFSCTSVVGCFHQQSIAYLCAFDLHPYLCSLFCIMIWKCFTSISVVLFSLSFPCASVGASGVAVVC